MKENRKVRVADSVRGFTLPRYDEIPNVGLYLEQTAKYISEYLDCLGDFTLTRSMISNYVKKGLITNPVKKQYDREQIAYLIFIAVAKNVLSLDALRKCNKVSFCTYDSGYCEDGDWALHVKSVIVFGKMEVIDDMDTIADITRKLSYKFTQDEEYIRTEIEKYAPATLLLQLTPEHICGKQITES